MYHNRWFYPEKNDGGIIKPWLCKAMLGQPTGKAQTIPRNVTNLFKT